MAENIFGIKQPQNIDCTITEYKWSGSGLHIKFKRHHSPEVQYLKFRGVQYFSGPFQWTGANFQTRSISDCLQIMQHAGLVNEHMDEHHFAEQGVQLYVVELAHDEVQIIASSANRLTG